MLTALKNGQSTHATSLPLTTVPTKKMSGHHKNPFKTGKTVNYVFVTFGILKRELHFVTRAGII